MQVQGEKEAAVGAVDREERCIDGVMSDSNIRKLLEKLIDWNISEGRWVSKEFGECGWRRVIERRAREGGREGGRERVCTRKTDNHKRSCMFLPVMRSGQDPSLAFALSKGSMRP